jgi:hypothetical protein
LASVHRRSALPLACGIEKGRDEDLHVKVWIRADHISLKREFKPKVLSQSDTSGMNLPLLRSPKKLLQIRGDH